jgi:RNA-directed DNA polymerase
MEQLELKLNQDKTIIMDARNGNFGFLGYTFGRIWFRKTGAWPDVRDRLNALLQGWSTYFCYGTTQIAYRAAERNVYDRVRRFLVKRHKMRTIGIHRFPSERVFGELGVLLPRPRKRAVRCVP